jgi:NADP-dependent 3-hydroxy acid dehydrogenase YdfG
MAGETVDTPDLLKEPPIKDEFRGKVAFVTGAGSGLGRASGTNKGSANILAPALFGSFALVPALAILLAKAGAKVGLFGRTESELQDCAKVRPSYQTSET